MPEPVRTGVAVASGTYRCAGCRYERDVMEPSLPPCPKCGNGEWYPERPAASVTPEEDTA